MTRRAQDDAEYAGDGGPLFAAEAARARADIGASRAAAKAERLEPGWKLLALAVVLDWARKHERFLMEDARPSISIPSDADPRSLGAVVKEAERLGFIVADGFAPANTSNRSAKVLWKSLVFRKESA